MTAANEDEDDLQALRGAWEDAFGTPPDKYLSKRIMVKALAWHRHCAANGGFPKRLKRQLRDVDVMSGRAAQSSPSLSPGSQLAREWNGRIYHVEVTSEGFRFDGHHYASLTAIARRITGTNWSGPRFFGLKPQGAG